MARRSGRIGPCRVADDLFPDAPKVPLPRRPSQAHPPLPSSVVGMTDGELCRAWRRSFATVARTGSTATKHAAVVQRATYLDEIERRDPRAFRLWLASGAWATGSPHCYLDEEPPCGRTDAA